MGACENAWNLNNKIHIFDSYDYKFQFIFCLLPSNREEMCQSLTKLGISCTVILDSAVGYVMEHVDMVMVGAEGVAESGGVINKVCDDSMTIYNSYNSIKVFLPILLQIGTYTMAICAKEVKKPFYVLTESFKFARIYPLNQVDLPNEFKVNYHIVIHMISIITFQL